MIYEPRFTDKVRSPYTGMTRESWLDAAGYLMQGIFDNIKDFNDPVIMPRKETEITYPHRNATGVQAQIEYMAEVFEGLTRSFFIAAPLIAEDPELPARGCRDARMTAGSCTERDMMAPGCRNADRTDDAPADSMSAGVCPAPFADGDDSLVVGVNREKVTHKNYTMREYYKSHILRSCTKGDPEYVGDYEYMQELTGHADPNRAFQQTVETCALVIGLWLSREQIWCTYNDDEKNTIAHFLLSFAHNNTVPQNWRLFNMLDMAFLYAEGYKIDREIMLDHAQAILAYYVGDGWYRDGHSFDYYSCWAFNVYAPLWNRWYGYAEMPDIARAFEEHSNRLMATYDRMFDRDGHMNMWGRSNIYRWAAVSPFDANFFNNHPEADPGLSRRIASGALLQFMTRDDFLYEGVPTIGYYGQFKPLVQGYSCAESPMWIGKAFLCLHLKKDHPFWTAVERNGVWEELDSSPSAVNTTFLPGPALCFTNHAANGETILRTGKVIKDRNDIHGMWNYAKLCFNTKWPWEAAAGDCNAAAPGISADGGLISGITVESQQYVVDDPSDLKADGSRRPMRGNVTILCKEQDGVLYRRQFFDYNLQTESHWIRAVNLADIAVPYGILRVDKHRMFRRPFRLTLGSYGFPDNGTTVERRRHEDGRLSAEAVIFKGHDHMGLEKQMAMTVYECSFSAWTDLGYYESTGTNPDSEHSLVAYGVAELNKQYGGAEPYLLISQVITKESLGDFTGDELFPVREITTADGGIYGNGSYGPIALTLYDGRTVNVDFDGIEAYI